MIAWSEIFGQALPYTSFLDRYANAGQRRRWDMMHPSFPSPRSSLICSVVFRAACRCFAWRAAWCGDCVNQCPVFDHFARASSQIELRFLDRDARPEVRSQLEINGGQRVPVVVFLSEDWYEVARYGDRPLSTYRQMAAQASGEACPSGSFAPAGGDAGGHYTGMVERIRAAQLILRLSPRLRGRYGD